jgi:hypothetical protein|tara:strand:- start:485 stop:1108 length:624 start_codon:yes stop_codon:yes gene_type:complete
MEKINPDLQMYARKPIGIVRHQPNFNPNKYISIQSRVNSDPEYEKEYISKLINEGWYQMADKKNILSDEMRGKYFKYRLNGNGMSKAEKGTFRSGGIIVGKDEENGEYINYKSFNGSIFPLQLKDILEIYIKDPSDTTRRVKKEKVYRKTVLFNEVGHKTNFPVYLKSKITENDILVYYARDAGRARIFMDTLKFKYARDTQDWDFK